MAKNTEPRIGPAFASDEGTAEAAAPLLAGDHVDKIMFEQGGDRTISGSTTKPHIINEVKAALLDDVASVRDVSSPYDAISPTKDHGHVARQGSGRKPIVLVSLPPPSTDALNEVPALSAPAARSGMPETRPASQTSGFDDAHKPNDAVEKSEVICLAGCNVERDPGNTQDVRKTVVYSGIVRPLEPPTSGKDHDVGVRAADKKVSARASSIAGATCIAGCGNRRGVRSKIVFSDQVAVKRSVRQADRLRTSAAHNRSINLLVSR